MVLRTPPASCLFVSVLLAVPATGQVGEIANASFEDGAGAAPAAWRTHTYQGQAQFAWAEVGHTGRRSVALISNAGADAAWQQEVQVHPYSTYRLSAWIKTEAVVGAGGRGALLNIHGLAGAETAPMTGTTEWTEVRTEFDTGARGAIVINCLLGGWGHARGHAWYDDLRLELVHRTDLDHPSVILDLGKEAGPISPFVYGQFIEHLGRCIDGGIWAEMLQDRKFLQRVGAPDSPWRRLGGEVGWSLDMDVERPCVNGWSVRIGVDSRAADEPHGIVQAGLGVVAGKDYVGRLLVAGKGTLTVSLWCGREPVETVQLSCDQEQFTALPVRLRAGASSDAAALRIGLQGPGRVWLGAASLMPADHVHGLRADTLAILQELGGTVYRWPGGNFVSGYDWRDGVGPMDQRPTRKNPAWQGTEANDFGVDEFLRFCRELGTEPLVVVNTGLGSPELAASLVEYCNGPADSPGGKRRAQNGHPEPYGVRWWGVGNEMYGGWQLGNVPLESYAVRHNEFVRAMRARDPRIQCVGVGATGRWSEGMLTACATSMDLLSEHFYVGEHADLMAHVAQVPEAVRAKAVAHRQYLRSIPALKERPILIALDEWNYWYGEQPYGELGVQYRLRDALGIAAGLHEMVRNRDVFFMANYAQTVNVIGCVKTSRTAACFDTTGLALALYRRQFGTRALGLEGRPVPLDVAAALSADGTKATIGIVNPTLSEHSLALTVRGGSLGRSGRCHVLNGKDPMVCNRPGEAPGVTVTESAVTDFDPAKVVVAPHSVTLFVLGVVK